MSKIISNYSKEIIKANYGVVHSLVIDMENETRKKDRRNTSEALLNVLGFMEKNTLELASKKQKLEDEVKPEFCRKCCRRTMRDVQNERFENWPSEWILTSVLERKDVMILLLLVRKYCPGSPFYADSLPLDIFKFILKLSEVCKVVEWKDRVAKPIPDMIQILLLKENEQEIAKNVVLKGHFRLDCYTPDHDGPIKREYFVKTQNLLPVKQESLGCLNLRWDDPKNLDWWCEFSVTPMGAYLRGRIPIATKCLGFTNYKDKDLRWTFNSDYDKAFWAVVEIFN